MGMFCVLLLREEGKGEIMAYEPEKDMMICKCILNLPLPEGCMK